MQLELAGVAHAYDGFDVLSGIDLTIASGEVVAVIGPSGCGKSTLLQIIGGLLKPTHGAVFQRGAPPAGCLNPLTYVFQDFALLPWRTVAGNVRLVLADHAMDRRAREARIETALRQTKLWDFRDAFPKQLSGGMRQRVGIARAVAVSPAALLMDEPLSALDAQTRELLMDEFAALFAATRVTGVYVTHNLNEAVRLAHRVVVLSRRPGRIREIVDIAMPMDMRRVGDMELGRIEQHLWSLIRDEAIAADRELAHAD